MSSPHAHAAVSAAARTAAKHAPLSQVRDLKGGKAGRRARAKNGGCATFLRRHEDCPGRARAQKHRAGINPRKLADGARATPRIWPEISGKAPALFLRPPQKAWGRGAGGHLGPPPHARGSNRAFCRPLLVPTTGRRSQRPRCRMPIFRLPGRRIRPCPSRPHTFGTAVSRQNRQAVHGGARGLPAGGRLILRRPAAPPSTWRLGTDLAAGGRSLLQRRASGLVFA